MAASEAVAGAGLSPPRRLVFGEFEIDLDRGSLKRRGEQVPLHPKSFAMLQYLLEHAGRLVTREELLAAVWPDVVVTDESVAQCLFEIRKALGDDEHSMVQTVPRRGLILDVSVRDAVASVGPTLRWSRYGAVLAALGGLAALLLWWSYSREQQTFPDDATLSASPVHSVAVLRFTDMSPAGDQAYLADGLSEEIMHLLAQDPSLRVIARVSSFALEGQSIEAIGEQLDVSHVLEGSVRRQGEELRVTAQLIDASSARHIWSRTYDRELDDVLDLQREIAGAVAGTLEVSLAGADALEGTDPHAYELFLEGQYLYRRRADGDLSRAQERFEDALALSPGFARAWVGLSAAANARLHSPRAAALSAADRERLRQTQQHATEQALQYGPNLPEAHIRASYFYFFSGDRDGARRHLEIARSIDPEHWLVRSALANQLQNAGRIEESIEIFRREAQRDPLNFGLRENVVALLLWAGRFEEAQRELERALELVPFIMLPQSTFKSQEPQLQILRGDFEAAAVSAESVPDKLQRAQLLALAWHGLGRQQDSEIALEEIASSPRTAWRDLYVAEVLAFRGESSRALAWLRGLELAPDCTGSVLSRSVYYSPFLAQLTDNPTWEEYRGGVLEQMQECLLGLEIDSI